MYFSNTSSERHLIDFSTKSNFETNYSAVKKFREDELEHHDTGVEHQAEMTTGYILLSKRLFLGDFNQIKRIVPEYKVSNCCNNCV